MLIRVLLFLAFSISCLHAAERDMPVSLSLRRSMSGAYQFVVRNTGSAPVYYCGRELPESAPLVYGVEIWREGKWAPALMSICGVGLMESFLRGSASLVEAVEPANWFEITPGERFRIVMSFSQERYVEGKKAASIRVYSNEITFIPKKG